ncbi:Protein bric-a-brac 1 [Chionoecetes opilio]|uniref:Protein bric-a-brac 1 n=1 Tax=Chionoecetes opilio TaxID=41210 RepID=A0A8J4YKU5_CHIOP|nr:Protein bric-a-brac 1 [Chionoecetes opilio]KAG0728744.1 Protein bric-a-brac 1 [Chionoecetes opilio]
MQSGTEVSKLVMSGTPPAVGGGGGGGGGGSSSSSSAVTGATGSTGSGSGGAAAVAPAAADHFCLRWNNYQTNMTAVFDQLLQEETSKRIKMETGEDDGHSLGDDGGVQQRSTPHPHYIHNGGAPPPPVSHAPPAAHGHHGHPPLTLHHGPPPLPELGPSVGLPPDTSLAPHVLPGLSPGDEGAGTSHAGDYNTSYGGYKTENDPQHMGSDATDSSGPAYDGDAGAIGANAV